ncbi:hypothetical protein RDI58_007251 [Solanum bulbocastanum]|uniref:Uncharacterized protein n=1 Tax=Solanum bulbocastanum TaxID=147425 RepID=A0AAN8YLY4_SOLBU
MGNLRDVALDSTRVLQRREDFTEVEESVHFKARGEEFHFDTNVMEIMVNVYSQVLSQSVDIDLVYYEKLTKKIQVFFILHR